MNRRSQNQNRKFGQEGGWRILRQAVLNDHRSAHKQQTSRLSNGRRDIGDVQRNPPKPSVRRWEEYETLRTAGAGFWVRLKANTSGQMRIDKGLAWRGDSFMPWLVLGNVMVESSTWLARSGRSALEYEHWSFFIVFNSFLCGGTGRSRFTRMRVVGQLASWQTRTVEVS